MLPKVRPEKPKYKVKTKIMKAWKTIKPPGAKTIAPSKGGGVFLAPAGNIDSAKQIPWMRHSENREDITPVKTLSLPQMLRNYAVKIKISEELSELLHKRADHHFTRFLKKNL